MILYFTGTGNSRYVAQMIGEITEDDVMSINKYIKTLCRESIKSHKPFVFVAPTYAWRIPKVVEKFIMKAHFIGNNKVYFVLTCGAEPGNAISYVNKLCKEKNFELKGLSSVVMPENYIAMFEVPDKVEANQIINKSKEKIIKIAECIKYNKPLIEESITLSDKFKSSIINPIFYPICVSSKGFYCTDKCIGCGKCAKLCALNNVRIIDKKPQWGQNCTHCMACICGCPNDAIEYKHKTKNKQRHYITGYTKDE
ncbi:MAG: EFR1 family ferrodoxin [Terrisporobacter sp.]|uniref:EFR1 family ferrodoxin n=1 Tax=Terrisporobacter sp. TaxID=1965305 RepID=UPI002FCBF4BE